MATATIAPLEGFPEAPLLPSAPASAAIEPVQIEVLRRCDWRQKPCGLCGKPKSNPVHRSLPKGGSCPFARKLNCAACGLPKMHPDHMGQPPSWNIFGSGDARTWWPLKGAWQQHLAGLLAESGLPKGLLSVSVEGEVTFPRRATKAGPDQGNFRAPLEKIVGDMLEEGGYIPTDSWLHYSFGGLEYRHEPGVSRTRLMIFGRMPS